MAKKEGQPKKMPDFSKKSIAELLAAVVEQLKNDPAHVDSHLQEAFVKKLESLERTKPDSAAHYIEEYQEALSKGAQILRERERALRKRAEAFKKKRERKTKPIKRPRKKPR